MRHPRSAAVASLTSATRELLARPTARITAAKAISDVTARMSLLLVVVLILRHDGSDALGAWSQLQVLVTLAAPFAVLGLAHAAVPMLAPTSWGRAVRRRLIQLFGVSVAVSLLAATGFAVAASWINDLVLHWENGDALFRVGGLLVGVSGIEVLVLALLQARRQFARYIVMQVASTVATVAVAAAVLAGDGDVVTFVGVLVVARASVATGGVLLALNGLSGDDRIDPPAVRDLARFGLGVAVAEIGAWSVQLADRLIYGHYGDAGSLGAYAAVYTAASLISVLGGAVFLPAFPALARAWAEGGEERLQQVVADVHRHLVVVVVPAVALVLVVARPALDLIGRGDVDPGALVVTFVVVSIGISQWNGPARFVLVAVEGARAVRLGWFAGMAVSIVAGFVLIPPFGLIGAATSTLIAYATVDVIFALRANRWAALRRTYAWRGTIRSAASAGSAAMAFEVVRLSLPATLPALALATTAFVGSFVSVLALTRRGPLGGSAAAVAEDDRQFLGDASF